MGPLQWHQVEAQWDRFRPRVARYWSRLPEAELQLLAGDRTSLVRLVKRHYALDQNGAEAQVDAWLAGLSLGPSGQEAAPPTAPSTVKSRGEGEAPGAARRG